MRDRIREHLADDLEAPSALAAVDALAARGIDTHDDGTGSGDLATVVDALLGVRL